MPWDSEAAKEANARSVETRRRRKDPNAAARDALLQGARGAAEVLRGVAAASDGFEDVKPDLRFKAAALILEYVLGKPRGIEDAEAEGAEKPSEPTFLDLLAAPAADDPDAERKLVRYREDGPR